MRNALIGLVVVVLAAIGAYWYYHGVQAVVDTSPPETSTQTPTTTAQDVLNKPQEAIGKSVEGRDIVAYHFGAASGSSTKEIVFVGGIHGGYEWNTVLVAYELLDYLKNAPNAIPAGVRVTVIPVLNPDGLYKVTGKDGVFAVSDVNTSNDVQISGRFNGNTVDLNRNFDCDWKSSGVWQTKKVSGGSAAFSEPETQALKAYVDSAHPTAAVVWFSSAGGVYASNCHGGVLAETSALTDIFASASGYPAHETWNYYDVTGDVANWFAKMQIPAISVLLTNHNDTEWAKNQKGVQAVLEHFAQ